MTLVDGPPKTFDEALRELIDDWREDEPVGDIIAALAAEMEELLDDAEISSTTDG